jgi:hypothetical protein
MARGGSYSTNQFADPTLSITVSHLKNFLEIIKSGRRQGFLELDIVVEKELDVRVDDKHLSLLQRVNLSRITPDTNWPNHWRMNVQYPELIYEQDVLGHVKSRTSLHKKHMNRLELKSLQEGIAFQERMTLEQKQLLLRAIGLDDEPFICTDDVYG